MRAQCSPHPDARRTVPFCVCPLSSIQASWFTPVEPTSGTVVCVARTQLPNAGITLLLRSVHTAIDQVFCACERFQPPGGLSAYVKVKGRDAWLMLSDEGGESCERLPDPMDEVRMCQLFAACFNSAIADIG